MPNELPPNGIRKLWHNRGEYPVKMSLDVIRIRTKLESTSTHKLGLNGCEEGTPQYTVSCQNSKVEILDKGNAMRTPLVQVLLGACLFLLLGLPLSAGPILTRISDLTTY
jgi:hypothetical protein